MFGVSEFELLIIFLALMILLKPEDIPVVFNKLGRWYRKCLRMYHGFLDEINKDS